MMRLIIFLFCAVSLAVRSQTLTLGECLRLARENYPAVRQYGLIEQSRGYTLANVSKGWLPQVDVSAGGYAFTDIIDGGSGLGRMGLDMNNYLAAGSVSVSQPVYDGGQIAAQRKRAEAESEVEKARLDVSFHAVDERVEELFFGILLLDEQMKQNRLLQDDLGVSLKGMESRMKNGVANQSDIDMVKVEILKARQQNEQLESSRKAFERMLSVFIGRKAGAALSLEKPKAEAAPAWSESLVRRPELNFYAMQNALLDSKRKQLDARLRPTVSAFATGMAHSQITDAVNNGLMLGGISLRWNIGALYTRKNDLLNLDLERQRIDSQRATFLFNNRLWHEQASGSAEALRRQLKLDGEIVSLRESIRKQSEKKANLGTESANELVRNVNAASQARLQQALHELQLLQEIYKLKLINNN